MSAGEAAPELEVDHAEIDNDSSLGDDDLSSYTESLRSSLLQSVPENGRKYHKYRQGKYILPDDDIERDRLDLQHQLFRMTMEDKLFLSPIVKDPQHVLDIGTGTGIWAIDMADEYPNASVIGTDLSAMQPNMLPPNCKFEVDDAEEEWTYNQKFDFIHARMMVGAFKDWPAYFKRAYNNMAPGGWIEMQDAMFPMVSDDGTLKPDSPLQDWNNKLIEAGKRSGRQLIVPPLYEGWMKEAGFVNTHMVKYKWPQNPWPKDPHYKELGQWTLVNIMEGLQGFSLALMTRFLGMTPAEIELLLVEVRKDMKNPKIHSYWEIYCVYGQKPESTVKAEDM